MASAMSRSENSGPVRNQVCAVAGVPRLQPARIHCLEVMSVRKKILRRVLPGLPLLLALLFWAVNAGFGGRLLAWRGGVQAFLKNLGLGATFITSVTASCTAFGWVLRRGYALGRDAVPGVGLGTIFRPFLLNLGVAAIGAALSALTLLHGTGENGLRLSGFVALSIFPVAAGFALTGSMVGNVAASVTLEARDLGRWTGVNIVLMISVSAFWLFLMWAVLGLLWQKAGAVAA
jgi:hypothetical protein